jgi:hypothetical protein
MWKHLRHENDSKLANKKIQRFRIHRLQRHSKCEKINKAFSWQRFPRKKINFRRCGYINEKRFQEALGIKRLIKLIR